MTKQTNHSLKARLFIGGLKSLFGDMHDMLEEVEKTGQMSRDMITSLTDVHEAIDLAVEELKKIMAPCCDHSPDAHHCDETCTDETKTVPYTGEFVGVGRSPTPPLGGPEAFVVEEGEEDEQEPVEEIQGPGKTSWGVCYMCGCMGNCEPNEQDCEPNEQDCEPNEQDCEPNEQGGCGFCGCGCLVKSDVAHPPSLRGPSPSDFSSMETDPEDIPFDSKRHLKVVRQNAPSGTFPTDEDFHLNRVVLPHPLSNIRPVDDPLGEEEETDGVGERLPAVKKQPKKKSKTKK